VYIIVVNWNGWKDTIECLESLLLLDYTDFRIVVCDNGSQDESIIRLRDWGEQKFGTNSSTWQVLGRSDIELRCFSPKALFTIVENVENFGFAGGTNVGLKYAISCGDAEFCWLLNNDTVVDSFALTALVNRMSKKKDASMCGSTLRHYYNRSSIQALGGAIYFKWLGVAWHLGRTMNGDKLPDEDLVEKKMDYVIAASLLVRSSYLHEVGLMAEDYFLYFEEIDWVFRGQGRYSLAYASQSIVFHKVGASIGTTTNPLRKNCQSDYYTLRNRIIFTRRYFPSGLPSVYFFLIIEMIIRLLTGRIDLAVMTWRLIRTGGTGEGII